MDTYLTDENFENYFKRNARDFDGTKLKVSQILIAAPLKLDGTESPSALVEKKNARQKLVEQQVSRLEQLRKQVANDSAAFAKLAKEISDAESAADGGMIGWIERRKPMPQFFNDAAFGLKKGEVSQPIVSPLGVHLIRCDDVKPGRKTWKDVRTELRKSISNYLFDWASNRQREKVKIKFMPGVVHFESGTKKIVN